MGEFNVFLVELEIVTPQTQIITDGQLFEKLKKAMGKIFLKTKNFRLIKPVRVHFVQVNTGYQNINFFLLY